MTLNELILIPVPCYRLNGDLWHEMETPCGASVSYHLSISNQTFGRYTPEHIRIALQEYRETLFAMLLAGF